MRPILSRSARILLIRGFFLVMTFAALYGAWDNRMFLKSIEFLFLIVADTLFALLFLYVAAKLPQLLVQKRKLLLGIISAAGLYIVITNVIGTTLYSQQLGLAQSAANSGFSIPLYLASESLYLVVLPTIAFYIVWRLVKNL